MEPPYAMISRTTSLDGLIVLRDFNDAKQISKWGLKDLKKELHCLALLKWETIARYGAGADVEAAKAVLTERGQQLGGLCKSGNRMLTTDPVQSRVGRDRDSIAKVVGTFAVGLRAVSLIPPAASVHSESSPMFPSRIPNL